MKYQAPFGAGDPDDPYVDFNDQTGEQGSIPGAAAIEQPLRELDHLVDFSGQTPSDEDLTQVRKAIQNMIQDGAHAVIIHDASFEGTVADGDVVLWDSGNTRFAKATADGTANNKAVGVANVTDGEVVVFGETPALFSGLTPGGRYYLDGSTAGDVTTTPPPDVVKVGFAKAADTMFVDIDHAVGGAPADIPFIAGYDSAGEGKDLAVQVYGRVICARPLEILSMVGDLATVATDAACIVDIEKNGTTIYSSNPQFDDADDELTDGTLDGSAGVCAAGDVLTFKVTQVGSTIAGQRMVVTLKARYL